MQTYRRKIFFFVFRLKIPARAQGMAHTTMTDGMTRTRALQTLAAGPFLCLGPHLHEFQPLAFQADVGVDEEASDLASWRANGSLFFTIACVWDTPGSNNVQIIYEHTTDTVYLLRRDAWVKGLSFGTQLVGQYVEDVLGGEIRPNFMIFDIVRHGQKDMKCIPPSVRYQTLLSMVSGFNNEFFTLQWVGTCDAVKKLLDGNRECIPHTIQFGLWLTKDPLCQSMLV